ncbi:MAG: hypothetical protein HQ580_05430 [Planctomycetes bacterium]|nr:hypothetical protein [Planctomycetota bacterium]
MKSIIIVILLTIAGCFAVAGAAGVERKSKPAETKNTYALIICGINKDPKERFAKNKAVINLRSFFLNNAKIKPARLSVLVADKSFIGRGSKTSNAENLKKTIKSLSATVQSEDRFIFYYVGQANIVAGKLRLNLPGQDITHEQLAEWINQIRASSMLLVLDCPGAGMAVKALTGQGRIVIGACTAEQHYSTQFSEYFVPSLLDSKSDTDGDGKVSILEAFTFSTKQLDDWYFRQLFLKTETPVLEDNADGFPSRQPWRYKQDKTDGREASKFFLSKG